MLHYRIRQALGRGMSSETFLAHDERLHRDVVLKVLVSIDRDAASVEREARILAQLSHPNIAGVHAVECTEGETFLVLEYVDGETLERVLAGGPLPTEAVTGLAHALLSALAHAHARGVLHRDLKPDNILIAQDGTVKLTDFGVARLQGSPFVVGASSSLYQSPEQARGDATDGRSDLYSLALVLAESATGSRVARRPGIPLAPEQLEAIASRLPPSLGPIVTRCLAARIEDRPESAHALLGLLGALEAADRRRPMLRGTAAAAAFAVAMFAVAWRFDWWPVRPALDPMTVAVVCAQQDPSALSEAFASAVSAHLSERSTIRLVRTPLGRQVHGKDLVTIAESARARRAGRVLLVNLQRRDDHVHSQLTLFESRSRRILWADARLLEDDLLPRAVAQAASELGRALGAPATFRYEWFLHGLGDSLLAEDRFALNALETARRGDIDPQFEAAGTFLTHHPRSIDAHVLMAYSRLSRNWALGPLDSPARAALLSALDALSEIDPRNPWDEALRALMMSRDGQLEVAVTIFSGVLANPALGTSGRAMVLAFRGQAQRDLGRGVDALRDLRQAMALDGTNTASLVMLADALGTFGEEREGLSVARRAAEIAPGNAQTHITVAHAHARLEQWSKAESEIRVAHRLAHSMDTQALTALTVLKQGRASEAARAARNAEREVETAWGRSILARYHAARGDQDAAFRELSRSVALGFADPEIERMADFDVLRRQPRFITMWPRAKRAA